MMPKLICALMILFGVLLIVRPAPARPSPSISWSDLPHAARVFAITAVAVALYTTLGFIITMSAMLFVLIALEGRNLLVAAAFSLGVTLSTYALFTVALKTPLEQGVLGF